MLRNHSHRDIKRPARKAPPAEPSLNQKTGHGKNSLWQSLALRPLQLQPKLSVSEPRDPYEQEADRVADRVMRSAPAATAAAPATSPHVHVLKPGGDLSVSRAQRDGAGSDGEIPKRTEEAGGPESSSTAPTIVRAALNTPGQPLDQTTRAFFESRFQHDFNGVRIHADEGAGRAAKTMNALAFTSGSDIAFGNNQYQPGRDHGKRLLAHELTHVVQQRGGHPTIQRQPAPSPPAKPAKFYQSAIDKLANERAIVAQQRQQGQIPLPSLALGGLAALIPLCEAVENESSATIPGLLDAFIAADIGFHLGTIDEDVMLELSSRMFKLGLESEAAKLRKHFDDNSRFSPWSNPGFSRREIEFYRRTVQLAVTSADTSTPAKIGASINFMIRVFVPIRDAVGKIDREALARERAFGPGMVLRPSLSTTEYYEALIKTVETLFGGIEGALQALMEVAAADLAAGRGAATLTLARDIVEKQLQPAIFPGDPKKDIAGLGLNISRQTISKGKGKISDVFLSDAAADKRSVPVNTYDPEQEFVRELNLPLEALYRVRHKQIESMARIYGITELLPREKPFEGKGIVSDAEENAETIKRMQGGQMRLQSDDDWRAFVLQKYQDMVHPQPGGTRLLKRPPDEALRAIMDLLFNYFQAFTIHARFTNIYDIGDNYLNKDFPRTLSGQVVHDCGVYALRTAYILSLVRNELKLRFRFVMLPAHVALVIDGDGLPTFIVQSDHYEEISAADMGDLRKQWENFSEKKTEMDPATLEQKETVTTPPGQRDETQFIGELTGSTFISGPLDMPFKVVDVPEAAGDPKTAQSKLWQFYQQNATTKVFGPASDQKTSSVHGFHNRYLALAESRRQMHNDVMLKFWNEQAPKAWAEFEKKLAGEGNRSTIPAPELLTLLTSYSAAYSAALRPVDAREEAIQNDERRISSQMREEPGLRRVGVRLGYGPRAATMWTFYWQTHRNRIANYITEVGGYGARTVPVTEPRDRLQPPFVPVSEKALAPLN